MLKVLIAEDNLLIADMLEDLLVSKGYVVVGIAPTVREAVRLADLYKPQLAVLDFRLARGGLGSEIRPLLEDRAIGILYLSGDPLDKILTKSDGEAYLHKPYVLDDVIHALRVVHEIMIDGFVGPASYPTSIKFLADDVHRPAA